MRAVAHCIALFAWLCFASSVAAEVQLQDWCPDEVFRYDANHELTLKKLADSTGATEPILANEWQRANELLYEGFRTHLRKHKLDPSSRPDLSLFIDAVDRYLAASIPPIGYMKATMSDSEEPGGRLTLDLGVDSAYQSIALSLSCVALPGSEEGKAIAYFARTLYEYGRADQWASIKIGSAEISRIYSTHRNRLTNGLPMWPQETWVNGLNVDFNANKPVVAPNMQWIFLRPSISPVLKFSGEESSELDAALMLEPFGLIKYREGSDFRKWQGASAIVTVSGDNGVGYGAVYRYDSLLIGAAHHGKSDDWLLYVSIDLYDLVVPKDRRTNEGDEFLRRLAAYLKDRAIKPD